jgi:glutamate synthase (NADPH/NADH) large chain
MQKPITAAAGGLPTSPAALANGGRDPAGLYHPAHERDSCGFGLIASLDDQPSHWLVATAIGSLNRLTHRGAVAADGKTGDGCGLLLKKPERFLRAVAAEAGLTLGLRFATGIAFLSGYDDAAQRAKAALEAQIRREGLVVAGWRVVPTNPQACGAEALRTLPRIEQVFVTCLDDIDEASFNRRLFLARRRTEKALEHKDPVFYMPSLSASTLVYKGMVMPQHLTEFYPDLADERLESSVAVFHQRFSTNT